MSKLSISQWKHERGADGWYGILSGQEASKNHRHVGAGGGG